MDMEIVVLLEDGNVEESFTVPSRFEVCERCEGAGKHSDPAIDGNGITSSEMDELGEEFVEDYMRGAYDIRCEECSGDRVVKVVDYGRLVGEDAHAVALWEEQEAERARMDAADRRTMRMEMGLGW